MASITILVSVANPRLEDLAQLRLREEMRQIKEALQRAKYRDQFEVIYEPATRTTDLQQALLDHRPQIVHFSGHGSGKTGLILETDSGKQQLVRTEALAQLFGAFDTGEIECVILNACYSEVQAVAIHQYVDCVVGMNQAIGDKTGVNFAQGFYRGLGAGLDYDRAFDMACSAIDLSGSDDGWTPELMYRKRAEAIAPALRAEAKAASPPAPTPEPSPPSSGQSQSFGNISISGSGANFNPVQSGGDVTIDQSRTQTSAASPDAQMALAAVENLKQAIASTDDLDEMTSGMAAVPIQKLEEELQKDQPEQSVISKAVSALQNTLDGVLVLAEPVAEVAKLVAKVGIFLV